VTAAERSRDLKRSTSGEALRRFAQFICRINYFVDGAVTTERVGRGSFSQLRAS
jgi:hypothetical protein